MRRRRQPKLAKRSAPTRHEVVALAKTARHGSPLSKRARGVERNERLPFVPPEDWHDPTETKDGYRCVTQRPGTNYRHILTPAEIRDRLAAFPADMIEPLGVVQLSRMTRKKRSFPCYGMQWGAAIYLYPIETDLVEEYDSAPKPNVVNEAQMYGGRWVQGRGTAWRLEWTEQAIKDFYLNNILIHELGHLLDDRNGSYVDRERYAEWFALHYGYRRSRAKSRPRKKQIARRHHSTC